jgi:hypothetical protein
MKIRNILAASVLALSASSAIAGGYGMAGCGLGSIVSNEMGWENNITQIFATTTNGTAGSQTFGITFGTSNCGDATVDSAKKLKKKSAQQVYLRYNLAQIKTDAAKGEGEYIEGLADLFGCQSQLSGSYADFARLSQSKHSEIFGSDSADVVWQNYMNAMQSANLSCNNG